MYFCGIILDMYTLYFIIYRNYNTIRPVRFINSI